MIERTKYLDKLIRYRDKNVIKVITGIRRSGKSYLMLQFKEYLKDSGIEEDNIIHLNLESLKYDGLKNYRDLYDYIAEKSKTSGKKYILLDEVQKVEEWEKAVSSFKVDMDCDIYITGSNAYLLSSEISTLLSGRYVEIHMLPLSFKEYYSSTPDLDFRESFDDYIKYGGFPGLIEMKRDEDLIKGYIEGVYNTVIVKDIIGRSKLANVDLLNRIIEYMMDNIGNLISANKISGFLTSSGMKTTTATVLEYIDAFEKAYVLYRAKRYNIRGKRILSSPDKYYVVDIGLRNALSGFESLDTGRILENIVYLELLRRGHHVIVGADSNYEIDFIAVNGDFRMYYQVSLSIADPKVLEREIKGFKRIGDYYPRILLTMDYGHDNIYGISRKNIVDFLLEEE